MQRIWSKIRMWWHIGTTLFILLIASIYWFHDVSAYGGDIKELQVKQQKTTKVLDRMDYNIQIIANKVGVVPLQKPADE